MFVELALVFLISKPTFWFIWRFLLLLLATGGDWPCSSATAAMKEDSSWYGPSEEAILDATSANVICSFYKRMTGVFREKIYCFLYRLSSMLLFESKIVSFSVSSLFLRIGVTFRTILFVKLSFLWNLNSSFSLFASSWKLLCRLCFTGKLEWGLVRIERSLAAICVRTDFF